MSDIRRCPIGLDDNRKLCSAGSCDACMSDRIEQRAVQPGMTLRDYFAGQALVGLLAHASGENPFMAPSLAFALADEMIQERDDV